MAMGEFDLIRRFFTRQTVRHVETTLGIGDDCALLHCPEGAELAITTDTLVAGVHFLPDVDPEGLGHKALAVSLSDLAAMGAAPKWATLALTLPQADEHWLEAFARGFFTLAGRHGLELVGGDTTCGPLSITVQALGLVPAGGALRRSGALPGDLICVSGPLGSAGLGLKIRLGQTAIEDADATFRLERPEPHVHLGRLLRGLATACIDISDGLAADLGHILTINGVGAVLDYDNLPLSDGVRRYVADTGDWRLPLVAGDDYELCFTVSPVVLVELEQRLAAAGLHVVQIGRVVSGSGMQIQRNGVNMDLAAAGYEHFS